MSAPLLLKQGYPGVGCSLQSGQAAPVVSCPHSKEIHGFLESLGASMTLWHASHSSQFCVTNPLAEGTPYPSPRLHQQEFVHQCTPHPGLLWQPGLQPGNLLDSLCLTALSIILLCRPFLAFMWTCLRRLRVSLVQLILCSLCSSDPSTGLLVPLLLPFPGLKSFSQVSHSAGKAPWALELSHFEQFLLRDCPGTILSAHREKQVEQLVQVGVGQALAPGSPGVLL